MLWQIFHLQSNLSQQICLSSGALIAAAVSRLSKTTTEPLIQRGSFPQSDGAHVDPAPCCRRGGRGRRLLLPRGDGRAAAREVQRAGPAAARGTGPVSWRAGPAAVPGAVLVSGGSRAHCGAGRCPGELESIARCGVGHCPGEWGEQGLSSIRARYLVHTLRFFFIFLSEIRIRLCKCALPMIYRVKLGRCISFAF